MKLSVPSSLKAEHDELHQQLKHAIQLRGSTGKAAEKVAHLLHPHFIMEEKYAMPPLALLPSLAKGVISSDMNEIIHLTDQLKNHLPEMLAEHQRIVAALHELSNMAAQEKHDEIMGFAEKLIQHAKTEEEVLYPAAILIGDYLKLKLQQQIKSPEYLPEA